MKGPAVSHPACVASGKDGRRGPRGRADRKGPRLSPTGRNGRPSGKARQKPTADCPFGTARWRDRQGRARSCHAADPPGSRAAWFKTKAACRAGRRGRDKAATTRRPECAGLRKINRSACHGAGLQDASAPWPKREPGAGWPARFARCPKDGLPQWSLSEASRCLARDAPSRRRRRPRRFRLRP